MAIKMMLFKNGNTGPVAVCDVCGKAIRGAAGATVYWRRVPTFDEKPSHLYDMVLVCNSDACEMDAEKGGGNTISTMDWSTTIINLLINSGMAPDSPAFRNTVKNYRMFNELL